MILGGFLRTLRSLELVVYGQGAESNRRPGVLCLSLAVRLSSVRHQTGWVSAMTVLSGKCLCGQVQVSVRGEPLRVGICHCTNCRQESGSAFTFYAIWPAHQFEHVGETSVFHGQHFCPRCGSHLFSADAREAEIKLGVLSEVPTPLVPSYELWIKRREPWLRPIEGAEQFEEDRK